MQTLGAGSSTDQQLNPDLPPNSPSRVKARTAAATECAEASATDRQRAMIWAQRFEWVFAADIETCRQCGGRLRVIASIEAPAVIERILEYLVRSLARSNLIRYLRSVPLSSAPRNTV